MGPPGRPPLVVYALPAVIGGGRGDVEEVRAAAWALARAGFPVRLPAGPGRVPPVPAEELRDWPPARPLRRLRREGERAMTVAPSFGVSAELERAGPLGRAGPWAPIVRALEAAYGRDRVVHLSLEEFARNLPAELQERERWREGGVGVEELRRRRREARWPGQVARLRRLYRRFRSLGRPNLLVLAPTFRSNRAFRSEFPEILECGPVAPPEPPLRASAGRARGGPVRWCWYASPATSARLLPGLQEGARRAGRPLELLVRSGPKELPWSAEAPLRIVAAPLGPRAAWRRTFARADLRIVTGSRSLLEALALGGPFLYTNGVLGEGRRRRAHRPEKLRSLLALWRDAGVDPELRRDLADFAAGRRVAGVVARALTDPAFAAAFPAPNLAAAFPPPFDRGDRLLVALAQDWSKAPPGAAAWVRRWRGARRDLRR